MLFSHLAVHLVVTASVTLFAQAKPHGHHPHSHQHRAAVGGLATDQTPHEPTPFLGRRDLPTGTCNANTPCVNAACCGTNGLCGYSPTECGSGNCTSNCDAKAECGQYGKTGSQTCPLGVCCSQFGFCGSSNDFCDSKKGCQKDFGGCGDVKRPSCSGNSITKRTIGYYEAWSNTRKCDAVSPEDLNLNGFSHINFAFAFFDPTSFEIAPMDSASGTLYSRFTALKDKNDGLQTWISVGGWSFTDPGPTRNAFTVMTSTAANRKKFITGLINFMEHYGFDGVDLDWEYPQSDDRGGVTADKANYVSLAKELKAAFGSRYGISMTLPTSYWYLQHFDLAAIQDNVDWFNFMTYDLHGTWDAQSQFIGPYIAPHTNVSEIDAGLDLVWRAGVKPEKVVMGLGWYGRSFTLADPSCDKPNGVCKFTGGADAGPCSAASGILTLKEITDIISYEGVTPVWDKTAMVKYVTWEGNQWVSYDDDDTFDQKRKFANSRCLGGTMVWAMDQRDQGDDNGLAPATGVTTGQQKDASQMSQDLAAGVSCYTTDCGATCKKGTNKVTEMNGQPGKLSTTDRCPTNKYRSLCCEDGTLMGVCKWRGYRGLGLSCMGGCDDDETEIVQDTNNHGKSGDQTCTGGIQSYCCNGFKSAPTKEELAELAKEKAEEAAEEAAEQAALDIAAKAFCRIAIPALLAPLEALEAFIPIIGEILDIAELAATPALIQLCTKGIEKEGKAIFKVFGKEHSITFDKPTKTVSRKPSSSHSSAKTSSCPASKRGLNTLAARVDGGRCKRKRTVSMTKITTEINLNSPAHATAILCDGGKGYTKACLNYASISANYAQYRTITCPYRKVDRTQRPVLTDFDDQRKTAKWDAMINHAAGCSPDEYPPAVMIDINDGYDILTSMARTMNARAKMSAKPAATQGQMVRYLDAVENREAGKLFNVCRQPPAWHTVGAPVISEETNDGIPTEWHFTQIAMTRNEYTLDFANTGNSNDYGIADNDCVPTFGGAKHPGYALFNNDNYFATHAAEAALRDTYPGGPAGRTKRWVEGVGLVVAEGNSTRVATSEELKEELPFDSCADESCSREMEALKRVVQNMREEAVLASLPPTSPSEASVESATSVVEDDVLATPAGQPESGSGRVLAQPRQTGGAYM